MVEGRDCSASGSAFVMNAALHHLFRPHYEGCGGFGKVTFCEKGYLTRAADAADSGAW
jgi:hypothetical protein